MIKAPNMEETKKKMVLKESAGIVEKPQKTIIGILREIRETMASIM